MTALRDGGAVLVIASAPTLTTDPDGTTSETPASDDTAVTRLDKTGKVLWETDPGLGSLHALQEMNQNRLLVTGSTASVIMDLANGEVLTQPRAYQRTKIGPGPNGRDVVFGFQGADSGGTTAVAVVDNSDGSARTLTTIDGFTDPELTPLGDATLVTSTAADGTAVITRFDLTTGSETWQITLDRQSTLIVDSHLLVAFAADPDESTLTLYAP